jgi:uncharacterized protein (DUF1697 family)
MKQYVAIIRGINVGGHNRVNMNVLREALIKSGLHDVRTYIQSGNIVFRYESSKKDQLPALITSVLKKQFNADVPVIVRDEREWQQTVSQNPFVGATEDLGKLLVSFLNAKPSPTVVRAISQETFPNDDFAVVGKDVYLFCRNGYGKTDIPNTYFEKRLVTTATTRNWKTVLQIARMLEEG